MPVSCPYNAACASKRCAHRTDGDVAACPFALRCSCACVCDYESLQSQNICPLGWQMDPRSMRNPGRGLTGGMTVLMKPKNLHLFCVFLKNQVSFKARFSTFRIFPQKLGLFLVCWREARETQVVHTHLLRVQVTETHTDKDTHTPAQAAPSHRDTQRHRDTRTCSTELQRHIKSICC